GAARFAGWRRRRLRHLLPALPELRRTSLAVPGRSLRAAGRTRGWRRPDDDGAHGEPYPEARLGRHGLERAGLERIGIHFLSRHGRSQSQRARVDGSHRRRATAAGRGRRRSLTVAARIGASQPRYRRPSPTLLHRFDFDFLARRIGVRGYQTLPAIDANRLHAEFGVVDGDIFQRVSIHLADVDLLLPIRRGGGAHHDRVAPDIVLRTGRT